MIGNRIKPRFAFAPKIKWARGTPIASVFFTEQKSAAIKSSRLSLVIFDAAQTSKETVANRIMTAANAFATMPNP